MFSLELKLHYARPFGWLLGLSFFPVIKDVKLHFYAPIGALVNKRIETILMNNLCCYKVVMASLISVKPQKINTKYCGSSFDRLYHEFLMTGWTETGCCKIIA